MNEPVEASHLDPAEVTRRASAGETLRYKGIIVGPGPARGDLFPDEAELEAGDEGEPRDWLYLCSPCIRRHELLTQYSMCSSEHPCECRRCDCGATRREGSEGRP